MAKKPTVTTLQSGFNSTEVLNENFENIRDAFDNTLSLDGSTPNAMQGDLDLNGNNLIGATGLLINGTDYLADVEAAKAAALVAQAAAELAENNAETAEVNAEASETAAGLSATAAATSATNAGASETAASASATASATSATNSSTSASQAATSASAAAVSEGNAATSETNAANSATSASGSASTSTAQASAASASATNAATSASNAATSETNASASETAAATSETNAAASESAVATSATNAATSEANAATSASTATTQASNAATSASAASASATNAATSETNAASSASSAASSASSAQASKDAALAALDSFDDRYLGQKVSDPTLDNDGNPLVAGALYFNTTDDVMKVYEGSVWVAAYASLSGALLQANNLSDVADIAASRTNLGLGTAATTASTDYATAAQGGLAASAVQPNDTPTFAGINTTGNATFGDNDKAIFGAGSDLQIYHDGSNSWIRDSGTGELVVTTDGAGMQFKSNGSSEQMLRLFQDGPVQLYYDNALKLATTSTGIDVTGTVTADGLTVEGTDGEIVRISSTVDGGTQQEFGIGFATNPSHTYPAAQILAKEFDASDSRAGLNFYTRPDNSDTASVKRLNIDTDGDISFYEDTGTTPKFFWDASAEALGIGTSSPDSLFTVKGQAIIGGGVAGSPNLTNLTSGTPPQLVAGWSVPAITWSPSSSTEAVFTRDGHMQVDILAGANSFSNLNFSDPDHEDVGQISYDHSTDAMRFRINNTERMRIDSSGNVGIGITNPTEKLHVSGNILATGDVTAFSDERLKTEIETISEAVDKVKQLRGVTFQKDGRDSLGVIAQEVQKVLPEVVHESGDYLSVAYGNIVGLLIEAVKEQQVQIDELKARVEGG